MQTIYYTFKLYKNPKILYKNVPTLNILRSMLQENINTL